MCLNKDQDDKQQSKKENSDRGESWGPKEEEQRSDRQHQLSLELKEKKAVLLP